MAYIALTFWLLAIVMTAWGVHRLWSGMIRAKVVNALLLPGTLVATLGHVLGLLVTGGTVRDTSLVGEDESGGPTTTPAPQTRIPFVGPIIVSMLPLLACMVAVFVLAQIWGRPVIAGLNVRTVGPDVPISLAGFWQLLRDGISLAESMGSAMARTNIAGWQGPLFLYLLVCLSVRMAPFPGHLRGALGAILIVGLGAALLSSLIGLAEAHVQDAWAILNLTAGTLLFLLIISALTRGIVELVRLVRGGSPE